MSTPICFRSSIGLSDLNHSRTGSPPALVRKKITSIFFKAEGRNGRLMFGYRLVYHMRYTNRLPSTRGQTKLALKKTLRIRGTEKPRYPRESPDRTGSGTEINLMQTRGFDFYPNAFPLGFTSVCKRGGNRRNAHRARSSSCNSACTEP
jgi:hypothetical protein